MSQRDEAYWKAEVRARQRHADYFCRKWTDSLKRTTELEAERDRLREALMSAEESLSIYAGTYGYQGGVKTIMKQVREALAGGEKE